MVHNNMFLIWEIWESRESENKTKRDHKGEKLDTLSRDLGHVTMKQTYFTNFEKDKPTQTKMHAIIVNVFLNERYKLCLLIIQLMYL